MGFKSKPVLRMTSTVRWYHRVENWLRRLERMADAEPAQTSVWAQAMARHYRRTITAWLLTPPAPEADAAVAVYRQRIVLACRKLRVPDESPGPPRPRPVRAKSKVSA
jgi:hypothetical protein